jgi:hypothetical protein
MHEYYAYINYAGIIILALAGIFCFVHAGNKISEETRDKKPRDSEEK